MVSFLGKTDRLFCHRQRSGLKGDLPELPCATSRNGKRRCLSTESSYTLNILPSTSICSYFILCAQNSCLVYVELKEEENWGHIAEKQDEIPSLLISC